MQQKNELPEGWTETPLEQILSSFESGSRPKGGVRGISEGIPSIGGEHLNDNGGFRFDKIKFVAKEFFEKMNQGIIEVNDILIVKDGATTGKISIVKTDFPYNKAAVNEHVFLCRPYPELSSYYIFYFLFSEIGQKRILNNFRGSAQGGINKSFAPNTIIPLPPLAEQHRIVSAIEALFARLNETNEKLDRVPEILKKFRQSVLAAACDGRLTEGWRRENPDIENSIIFLKKIENEVMGGKSRKRGNLNSQFDEKPYDLPLKWNWTSLSDVSTSITDGDHQAPPKSESGVQFIVISNISSGKLDLSKTMYVSENYYKNLSESRKPKPQDILYSVTGSYGIPILISEDFVFCFQRHIALIRPHNDVSSKYLYYILKSTLVYNQATKVATGIAQLTVPLSGLRMIRIPIPPLPEQQEIVRRVDALFAFADSIETKVAAAREKTEKLRQSLLAKAFSGELVETEAEIARREGREYESAEVLLERIKAEKGKSGKKQ